MFIIPLLSNIVIADVPSDIAEGTKNFIEGVKSFGGPVFEALLGSSESGNQFVIQILAFILVTLIIYGVLDSVNIFGGKGGLNFIIALIVSLIGIRFLPSDLLQTMALPSSALIAAIVLLIPFVIAFYIIEVKMKEHPIAGKLIWTAFGIIIIFLWFSNWENSNLDGYRWIYPAMVVACFIVLWFHGTIQKWFRRAKDEESFGITGNIARDIVQNKIRELQSGLASATNNEERIRLNKEIIVLRKNLINI